MKKVYYRNDYHKDEMVNISLDTRCLAHTKTINFRLCSNESLKDMINLIHRTHKLNPNMPLGLIEIKETLLKNILYN